MPITADPSADPTPRPGPRPMASRRARVVSNEVVRGGCHVLRLEPEAPLPTVRAGQFAMLSAEHPSFPILPRPFSVLGWRPAADGAPEQLEFLIMPVGRGSGVLCGLPVGGEVQVVAPMGCAFDVDVPAGPVVAVAGGYGVAPFLFLAETWAATGDPRLADLTVVFGARTDERLSLVDRLEAAGCRVLACTEDGSRGFHGRVDACLRDELAAKPTSLVFTCGPEAMMEAVGEVSRAAGVPCRASLETVMGCGYAVCNGCAVAVGDPSDPEGYTYELACREGTVFDEARLQWQLI